MWEKVYQAGRPYGIKAGTPNAIERIESALVSYGADTDSESNPLELGLHRFLDLDAPVEFVGKAALQKIAAEGPQRKLTGLLLDGGEAVASIEHKCPVYAMDRPVGFISVAVYSPRLQRNIGIALLAREVVDGGGEVVAKLPTGDYRGTCTDLPFCR